MSQKTQKPNTPVVKTNTLVYKEDPSPEFFYLSICLYFYLKKSTISNLWA